MKQEVQVVLTLEVDAIANKEEIGYYIKSNLESDWFSVVECSIKEEAEIYGTEPPAIPKSIPLLVTGGQTCPKCKVDGLFKTDVGYRCEECLYTSLFKVGGVVKYASPKPGEENLRFVVNEIHPPDGNLKEKLHVTHITEDRIKPTFCYFSEEFEPIN